MTGWLLLFVGLYPYLFYPILLRLISLRTRRTIHTDETVRTVTVVIAAYNEEAHIEATIENKLAQEYPSSCLNVLVVSDGSNDMTDSLVGRLYESNSRVTLLRHDERRGKTAALNLAVSSCDSEIIVFSDANSSYAFDAVKMLVRNFADSSVGYVTGKMIYSTQDGAMVGDGCSAYMRYENMLRGTENRVGSVVGVDGGIDAIRRRLYMPMRNDQLPDFVLPLAVVRSGFRVIYESEAVLREPVLETASQEHQMRVRVTTRAIWALLDNVDLLNPFKDRLFAFQLLSHKWMRYGSFIPFSAALMLSVFFWKSSGAYAGLLGSELGFLAFTALGSFEPVSRKIWLAKYCFYFFLLNYSCFVAVKRVLAGQRYATWKPRVG